MREFKHYLVQLAAQYLLYFIRLAAGEIPDHFYVTGENYFVEYVNQGVLAELPIEVVQRICPVLYADWMDYDPTAFPRSHVNGKLYGIPSVQDVDGAKRKPCVWRGDWLEKVGIAKTPETLAEYEDAFYKFAKNDPD